MVRDGVKERGPCLSCRVVGGRQAMAVKMTVKMMTVKMRAVKTMAVNPR